MTTQHDCFIGSTLLSTTWGRCTLTDLARLSAERDKARERIQATKTQAAEDFGAAHIKYVTQVQALVDASEIDPSDAQALIDASQSDMDAELTKLDTVLAKTIENRLPRAHVFDAADNAVVEREIVKVWKVAETSELVDVVIGLPVGDAPAPHVRCTPGHLFMTVSDTLVPASQLVGQVIRTATGLDASSWRVVDVLPIQLEKPVDVYEVAVDGGMPYCVTDSGSSPFAVVRSG